MTEAWASRLRLAVRLGLTPDAFWTLSIAEWQALTRMPGQASPLSRAEFDRLSRDWPDEGARA
ncbi:phage tail assembly chaperone [Brevundimonas halotolerans]|uniref:Putative phage protein (TIGR02216 family) n=1 Tax=Brevundimonas halotolerans TaxID=69670 RepID=A0A7W9E6L8_9CAUL|nr:phage tail assembly chaperone [Brevundimonas halotolerans]MBB5659991.1 putative phage protein (TIGR02216 family) [Brevundimonas halotolerans]